MAACGLIRLERTFCLHTAHRSARQRLAGKRPQPVTSGEAGGTTGKVIFSAANTNINGAIYGAGNVSFPSGYTDYDGFFYSVGGMTSS